VEKPRYRWRHPIWAGPFVGLIWLALAQSRAAWDDVAVGQSVRRPHWAFAAIVRPEIPRVRDPRWPRNPIDHFVLDRLEREGLQPSPEASKVALIRRVTLDLTGLPPTPEEVDGFLADESPDAYERLVDRLFASPRFGERMAVPWLYAARYADTSGYQNDGPRQMWRWRDWVIDAFNSNKSFREFTIEQIAGDMLSHATTAQRIATGFNRNHRGNAEGGIIPEEYAVEYVVDRVETTATVFLGLTLGCARCHDHKYDPLTQRDFYRVFAYFNNVPEFGRAIKEGNSPPTIQAPTREDERRIALLERQLAETERQCAGLQDQLKLAQAEWEKSFDAAQPLPWQLSDGRIAHWALDGNLEPVSGTARCEFRDGEPAFGTGRLGAAAEFDGTRYVDAGDIAGFGYFDKFSFGAWILPADERGGTVLSRMADAAQADGYYLHLAGGKLEVNLVKRWLDDAVRVETERTVPVGQWTHVAVTYDGSRQAKGIRVYVNGRPEPLHVNLDFLNQSFATKEPFRIGGGGGPDGRFHGRVDEAFVFDRCLDAEEIECLCTTDSIDQIVATPPQQRSPAQSRKLARYFLSECTPAAMRQPHMRLVQLQRDKQLLIESIPTVMVMEEMPTPRDTFVLQRGVYDKFGERVTPGVPAIFSSAASEAASNRLEFGRWLVDPSNPLTARVAVNRFWQLFFGVGLVKSAEDFGSQGDPPTHRTLLDWLAADFMGSDGASIADRDGAMPGAWDVKGLLRLIVTSATYRQSSRISRELLAKDPENRLLARGTRQRLSAECIRDQVLAASGLLVERLGGPSVRPYQPPGLWKEIATDGEYVQDHGETLYRRSLYTYWKRTVAPPSMTNFDATAREACTVRETRTNTPLQALTLLNEVGFVEASRVLAERAMTAEDQPEARIRFAFRLVTARMPSAHELQILTASWREYLEHFQANPKAALDLIQVGEYPRDERLDPSELAAYAALASLMLNLDEAVTNQ
jgi:hypothetical protein